MVVAPSRERELKRLAEEQQKKYKVAPSRERELKHAISSFRPPVTVAPSRERELKRKGYIGGKDDERSLPHGSVN